MQTHLHPRSGASLTGMRLAAGAILRADDQYDSSDGQWRACNHVDGNILQPRCTTYWVRPNIEFSENARVLLGYLNSHGGDLYACIAERNGRHYVLPRPDFNWDGRMELQYVQHPECVQELVDYGYLTLGEHDVRNSESDYATSGLYATNKVYTLTDEGKQEGARLLSN